MAELGFGSLFGDNALIPWASKLIKVSKSFDLLQDHFKRRIK